VRVREGTQTGDRLRLRGLGFPRLGGYQRGDQFIVIRCGTVSPSVTAETSDALCHRDNVTVSIEHNRRQCHAIYHVSLAGSATSDRLHRPHSDLKPRHCTTGWRRRAV
jgi:DnaJ-class molecular chaperone